MWIKNYASPVFRKNKVHHGKDVGFFVFQDGQVRERVRRREGERERVGVGRGEGGRDGGRGKSCLLLIFSLTLGSIGRE